MRTYSNLECAKTTRSILGAVLAYAAFCGLGFSCRLVPSLFSVFVVYGIAFPLLWALRSRNWSAIGFTKHNFGKAGIWGIAAGTAWGSCTYSMFGGNEKSPPLLAIQVIIALPVWLIFLSPFQEFFFGG